MKITIFTLGSSGISILLHYPYQQDNNLLPIHFLPDNTNESIEIITFY